MSTKRARVATLQTVLHQWFPNLFEPLSKSR